MSRIRTILSFSLAFLLIAGGDALAQRRGGGGGARGGGGGARGGGMARPSYGGGMARPSYGGGMARPSYGGGMARPSYGGASRPANIARPSVGAQRPSAGVQRPNYGASRPNVSQRPVAPGGGMTRPNIGGGASGMTRPSTGARPSNPGGNPANRPNLGGVVNRPNGGGAATRPSIPGGVGANRPSTLPGGINRPGGGSGSGLPGIGNRPGGGTGNRPGGGGNYPGIGNRPGGGSGSGLPGIGNRPGGGNYPGIGNRPGGGGNFPGLGSVNRPGGGGNFPGLGSVNRPGGNRPGIGGGNNNNIIGGGNTTNIINNRPNYGGNNIISGGWGGPGGGGWGRPGWGGGAWGRPGWGAPGWGGPGWGAPGWGGWYHGSWGMGSFGRGFVGGLGWGLGSSLAWGLTNPFIWSGGYGYAPPFGLYGGYGFGVPMVSTYFPTWGATSLMDWGLDTTASNWLASTYNNPYVVQQPITNNTTIVYDYGKPIDVTAPTPEESAVESSQKLFESARDAFKSGNYAQALSLTDQALPQSPNDPVTHEFRALCLFALGRYDEAAQVVYAVLNAGPGWDWSTLVSLYGNADDYTQQLRSLEASVKGKPDSAPLQFLLGYHYLVQGFSDDARARFEKVTQLAPTDKLSAQFVKALTKAQEAQAAPEKPAVAEAANTDAQPKPLPPPPANLVGIWKTQPAEGQTITLSLRADGTYTWSATSRGRTQSIDGKAGFQDGVLALTQEDGSPLTGKVSSQENNGFTLQLGEQADAPKLTFNRE